MAEMAKFGTIFAICFADNKNNFSILKKLKYYV